MIITGSIIVILVVLIVIGKAVLFPRYEEIALTGQYEVESNDYWVSEDKEEPYLQDGSKREVQVRAWYPKDVAKESAKKPVVVVSHGSCGTIDNNRTLYRELASHGYVVLAVSHPGHAFSTLHSNGKKQSVSMDYLKEMGGMDPQTKLEEAASLFAKWMELRMDDLNAVMEDCQQKAEKGSALFDIADANHFITIGHSAGGSAAMGMARVREDVVGVIALEAPCMYDIKGVLDDNYIIDDTDYNIPVLNVYSDSSYSHLEQWKQYRNNVQFLKSDNPNYVNIHYEGVGHMGLCDLSLASPILACLLDQTKSEVEPAKQLKKLNEDCLKFLERF